MYYLQRILSRGYILQERNVNHWTDISNSGVVLHFKPHFHMHISITVNKWRFTDENWFINIDSLYTIECCWHKSDSGNNGKDSKRNSK